MRNIAVILAGGIGSRMKSEAGSQPALPKQFMPLAGRAVIEYSLDTFDSHPAIDEVAVVVHPDWRAKMEEIAASGRWKKLKKIIDGGSERYMSSINAIMTFIDRPDDTNLMLHDAARPLVSVEIIDRVAAELQHSPAVGVAIPSTDTIWEVHPDISETHIGRFVARTPERRLMWQAQTPQAFRLPLIRDAYQCALQDPQFAATDDCSVVRRYQPGTKISVVEGDIINFKLTTPTDMSRAEALLQGTKR